MAISQARLEEFIAIYEQVYGDRLSSEDARPIATRLVTVYRLIMQPPPGADASPRAQTDLEAS